MNSFLKSMFKFIIPLLLLSGCTTKYIGSGTVVRVTRTRSWNASGTQPKALVDMGSVSHYVYTDELKVGDVVKLYQCDDGHIITK